MKILYTVLVFMMIGISAIAQSSKEEAIGIEKKIIAKAKRIGDPVVASFSMYKLIALEGENSTYKDSLTYMYYSAGKYASCFMMANEVLKRDPKNEDILELKASSLESLGALDKAMEVYAELFELSNNNYHGYNLSKLQLSIKKFEDAYTTIKKVEGLNDSGKVSVTFSINQTHTQQIELLAAIPYLKGLIEEELDKNDEAKLSYQEALKIQPEFVLAKEKLDRLN
ncbi:tetratricopeptide repeat protein [Lutimonas sp.]|uniref:tetratricopeptide repeat protein n=1 Tax=Lutimonas sp. TaxID=1872403 RepID=UPI003C77EF62